MVAVIVTSLFVVAFVYSKRSGTDYNSVLNVLYYEISSPLFIRSTSQVKSNFVYCRQ